MKIAILDTETTSICPGQIAQISYLTVDGAEIAAKNYYFAVDAVDPSAAAVNGLTVEGLYALSGGEKFASRAQEISDDLCGCGYISAHNVRFDLNFLCTEFARSGTDSDVRRIGILDTMTEFVDVCKLPRTSHDGYKYPKMGELTAFLGIGEDEIRSECVRLFGGGDNFHDARYDVTAVWLSLLRGRSFCEKVDRALRSAGR